MMLLALQLLQRSHWYALSRRGILLLLGNTPQLSVTLCRWATHTCEPHCRSYKQFKSQLQQIKKIIKNVQIFFFFFFLTVKICFSFVFNENKLKKKHWMVIKKYTFCQRKMLLTLVTQGHNHQSKSVYTTDFR